MPNAGLAGEQHDLTGDQAAADDPVRIHPLRWECGERASSAIVGDGLGRAHRRSLGCRPSSPWEVGVGAILDDGAELLATWGKRPTQRKDVGTARNCHW